MKKIASHIKNLFINWETSFHTVILGFVPLITLFSVMSDRQPYNYINIALYAVEILLIVFYVWKWKRFRFDVLTFCIVLFNICILVSQIINKRLGEYPTTILLLSVFAIVFYQFVYNEENKDFIYELIVIGGLLFALYFIFTYRSSLLSLNFADRLGEDFSDQNDLAKYLAIFALLSLGDIYKEKRYWKILPVVSTIIFVLLMLISGSVSNLLCFFFVGLLILIFCAKRKNRLYVLVGAFVLGAAIYGAIQLPFMKYFKDRLDGIFNAFFEPGEKVDGSASDRIKLFVEGFELFLTRPLFGYGYDQVQYYTHGIGQFSHSNVVELLASFGVVGFLAFETLLVYPLYYSFKNDKYRKNASITLFYLFLFQFFLIIFRKKIEFMLIPLGFSAIIESESKAIEMTFDGFKPTIVKIVKPHVQIKPRILLLSFSTSQKNVLSLTDCKKIIDENFEFKSCLVNSKETNKIKYDFSLDYSKNNFKLKRSIADVLDEVNPTFVIVPYDYAKLVAKASFGKNLKVLCYITGGDTTENLPQSYKIYKIFESKEPLVDDVKKKKSIDKHNLYVEKIKSKKEFNNLINLLKQ